MSRLLCLLLVLGLFAAPAHLEAKGPKGKGKGGGFGFKGGGKGGGQKFSRPGGRFGSAKTKGGRTIGSGKTRTGGPLRSGQGQGGKRLTGETATRLKGRDHAFNRQRLNEDRKLAHRQQTAQKLREISERNGNENLLRTADKMDQQALSHYDKRMSKIDSKLPQEGIGEATGTPLDQPASLADQPLSGDQPTLPGETSGPLQDVSLLDSAATQGLSPADARRLAQEDWKLQHQLDVAQRLRDNAARNGNENLLRTAERMENMAATRYQRQLEKFDLFSEPDASAVLPTEPVDGI